MLQVVLNCLASGMCVAGQGVLPPPALRGLQHAAAAAAAAGGVGASAEWSHGEGLARAGAAQAGTSLSAGSTPLKPAGQGVGGGVGGDKREWLLCTRQCNSPSQPALHASAAACALKRP